MILILARIVIKIVKWVKRNYLILSILFIAGVLRFVNLGYSDYQGDEFKAMFNVSAGQPL